VTSAYSENSDGPSRNCPLLRPSFLFLTCLSYPPHLVSIHCLVDEVDRCCGHGKIIIDTSSRIPTSPFLVFGYPSTRAKYSKMQPAVVYLSSDTRFPTFSPLSHYPPPLPISLPYLYHAGLFGSFLLPVAYRFQVHVVRNVLLATQSHWL